MNGGYDDGYSRCPCFWGKEPGSFVKRLVDQRSSFNGLSILDAGCGEGKNAIYLARLGATVAAVDISARALLNARNAWHDAARVSWEHRDIQCSTFRSTHFDIVILYGLLHCLPDAEAIHDVVVKLQQATVHGGLHVVCTFNDRFHDLRAHPDFDPTLCPHEFFVNLYNGWRILQQSDTDLHETHPHNGIPHVHSMTRLMAEKEAEE